MNLEQQVCSLELSKKLLTLGVKQLSLLYYCERLSGYHSETEIKLLFNKETTIDEISKYSAFTVGELGEMTPNCAISFRAYSKKYADENWISQAKEAGQNFRGETEANARAKMLIYLIENKLMELEDLTK